MPRFAIRMACGLAVLLLGGRGDADEQRMLSYNRDIRPILSNNCFHCHGPDDHDRKAKLRLDTKEGALGSGRSGLTAIVPGKSAESEVILRVTTTDENDVMPPADSAKKLNAKQIDLLKRWIDEGAVWGNHWAYVPPQAVAPPTLRNAAATPAPFRPRMLGFVRSTFYAGPLLAQVGLEVVMGRFGPTMTVATIAAIALFAGLLTLLFRATFVPVEDAPSGGSPHG